VRSRTGASYRNTQEDAWALLALEDYRRLVEAEPPNFGANVFFANERVSEFAFRGLPVHTETAIIPADIVILHPEAQVGVEVVEKGVVNYAVQLRLAKDGTSKAALDEGFSVEKLTRALEPAELQIASRIIPDHADLQSGLGKLVLVDVLLETAEVRDQVVLDDPLPAGLEPVEFGFQTTAQALSVSDDPDAQKLTDRAPRTSRYGRINSMIGVHREMHDDHVLHFIPHLEPGIYHFAALRDGLERIGGAVSRQDLLAATADQPWLADAPALLIHSAVLERTRWRYETRRAYRDILIELGHVSQTALLVATALGIGAVVGSGIFTVTSENWPTGTKMEGVTP